MRKIAILLVVMILAGCSTSPYNQGRQLSDAGHYDQAIEQFRLEILDNHQNAAAWREMGIAYYRQGDLVDAAEALEQANQIAPHALAHLYLGLIHEKAQDYEHAQEAYQTSLSLQPRGKTKRMVRAHLNNLIARRMQKEVREAIDREESLDVAEIRDNTIAVVDFDNTSLPLELAPISKGLAEFTAIDLAKVQSLTVVERLKINTLLRELELSQTKLVDPSTRLRVGRLVGSRNIVTGSVQVFEEEALELHGAIGDTRDGTADFTEPKAGQLERIFKVQKDFVFEIIGTLGITLTPEERAAIEEVPTESFLAFMAYCKGLEHLDHGQFEQAAEEFNRAAAQDENFSEAQDQAENMSDVQSAAAEGETGSVESFEEAIASASEDVQEDAGELDQQLASLVDGSGFMPNESNLDQMETTDDSQPDPTYEESLLEILVTVEGHINE